MDWAVLRERFVNPAAAVLSDSLTIAITYDCLGGTSIWERDCRQSSNATAVIGLGASATEARRTLEGRWVKTMVFSNPIRFAILHEIKKDSAVTI